MADPKDPLGVLTTDRKQLELISQVYDQIQAASGRILIAARGFTEEQRKAAEQMGILAERSETAARAEAEIKGFLADRARLVGDINEQLRINKSIRDAELQVESEALAQIEKNLVLARQKAQAIAQQLADRDDLLIKLQRESAARKEQILLDRRKRRTSIEQARVLYKEEEEIERVQTEHLRNLEEIQRANNAVIGQAQTEITLQAQKTRAIEQGATGIDRVVGGLDSAIERTGFFSETWREGILGGLVDAKDHARGLEMLFDDLKLKAQKISLTNLSANVLKTIRDETKKFWEEFDRLGASFRQTTGVLDTGFAGIEQNIVNVQRANLRMGVSLDEAFKAGTSLQNNMAAFSSMTDRAQGRVMQATAVMAEFGVSTDTTAEIFNKFSKGLGYDSVQLEKLSTQMMALATSLKMPPQIIATEFNTASAQLMKYGGEMMKVFKGLAEQSKRTGLAISELMGVAAQFDTFETAGDAVGRLNAILGGPYLNAINMVYATEEGRIKMMRESIQMSGRQFSALHRFEQQAIATAAGITDMSVAARLFGGTNAEFAKTNMEMRELQERAAKAQSVTDKFKQVMMSFAIALGPVVHILGGLAEALVVALNPLGELLKVMGVDNPAVINTLGGLTVAIYGVAAAMKTGLYAAVTGLSPAIAGLMSASGIGMMVTVFAALSAVLAILPKDLRRVAGGFVALAGAASLVAVATSALSLNPFAVAAIAGATAAGAATVSGTFDEISASYAIGKPPGESVPGGKALVGESGPELVKRAGGQNVMVSGPTIMPVATGDAVLTSAATQAAASATEELVPVLSSLQTTVDYLAGSIAKANAAETNYSDDRELVIKLDGRKVASNTMRYIKRSSNLRLG